MADKELGKNGRPEGGDLRSSVRIDLSKKISVNQEFNMSRIQVREVDPHEKAFRCCMCGHVYNKQQGNFMSGGASPLWKGNNGYLPFCKPCCETLMSNYTSFYSGNEEHALRHLCCMFDWYYCDMASAMTKAQVKLDGSRALLYPSKANTRQVVQKGTTFLDTIRDESIGNDIVDIEDIPDQDDEPEFCVTREMVRTWGKGFTADQYQFLEEEFADWTSKNVCKTKAQEELFRNISLAQLDVRIARQNGGKVTEAQKALQDLMNSANILPKQNADNILADTQTFGTLLKKYEETAPIPEPDERWKDVDGIRRYMNTWFRGGLAKALKINNENSALYEEAVEEMGQYTVHPVSVTASDSSNDASIFDQGAGEGGDDNG